MRPIRWLSRGAALATLGVAGGAAVVTARHLLATPQVLESRLFGDSRVYQRGDDEIYYNMAGPATAEPIVLLHDFYPGASNDEFRRIYPRLAPDFRVYAPDWLGFGISDRPALAYTGEFYAHLLTDFLRDTVGRPATVLTAGRAGNIAVRAASDSPELFTRLVLIEPRPLADTLPGPTPTQTLLSTLQRSGLGLVPYALLATRTALRWQLRRQAAYAGEGAATDDVLDHVYASAHQFGGQHALLALLTGELDLPVENALPLLEPPVLIVGGAGDGSRSLAALQDLALLHPDTRLLTIPEAGPAVHEEQPAALMEQLTTWLRTPRARSAPQISETRATARTFAGAIRVEREVTPGPAQERDDDWKATERAPRAPTAATEAPRAASDSPSDVRATEETNGSATGGGALADSIQPDASEAPETINATMREQFDEPHGMITPTPGLEGLAGLAERMGEDDPLEDGYDLIPEARPLPMDTDARAIGKPASELEATDPSPTTGAPAGTKPSRPATMRPMGPNGPAVTSPAIQPSESAPATPGAPRDARPAADDAEPGGHDPAAEVGTRNATDAGAPTPSPRRAPDGGARAAGAEKRGAHKAQREWPVPSSRPPGSHRHKHGHH
ncbi:MAG TPA: alpha/beta fold hydrolase [Ktedonobacterales bacterium]|nr:alpha/beta fold hydrolase [Ktedonobacterales bacterium]